MKISDLDENAKKNVENLLDLKSNELGFDSYEPTSSGGSYKALKDMIGICFNCKSFSYCKTEFQNVFAKCLYYEIRLSGQNRIVECNNHTPRGILPLSDMQEIAILIDVNKPVTRGFISKDPKFLKKKD